MSEVKCEHCLNRITSWRDRVEWRRMIFCGKPCLSRYKIERGPYGEMRNKGSRTTPCGPAGPG